MYELHHLKHGDQSTEKSTPLAHQRTSQIVLVVQRSKNHTMKAAISVQKVRRLLYLIVKRMNGHLKGRLNMKVLGQKEDALTHAGQ